MRKRFSIWILFLWFLIPSCVYATSAKIECIKKGAHATVLLYHKFNEPRSPSTSISTETFESHLAYLKNNSYNVISLDRLVEIIKKRQPFPPKTVVITIDDGYRSVYREAFPLLKRYEFPFAVFLYMEAIDRYPDYMTKEQLLDMARYEGVTFGNHSYSHERFGRMNSRVLSERLVKDIEKSEKRFKTLLGYSPLYYAYPYGEYNISYVETIKKRGYKAAFTQDPFTAGCFSDLYLIPRVPLMGSWSSIEKLREFLEREPLPVKRFNPDFGLLSENPPEMIYFQVDFIENYTDFRIYVTEHGWFNPVVNIKDGIVYLNKIPPFQRDINRVAIRAVNKTTGKKAFFFYMVIIRASNLSFLYPLPLLSLPHRW
jgi:peptidoglycan/xylan/chitin deacetylase (PgdA/CDA1 family)